MNASENKPLITFLILIGFLSGIVGGVGGMAVLATSSTLQKVSG